MIRCFLASGRWPSPTYSGFCALGSKCGFGNEGLVRLLFKTILTVAFIHWHIWITTIAGTSSQIPDFTFCVLEFLFKIPRKSTLAPSHQNLDNSLAVPSGKRPFWKSKTPNNSTNNHLSSLCPKVHAFAYVQFLRKSFQFDKMLLMLLNEIRDKHICFWIPQNS